MYSGMAPGILSGRYTLADAQVDVARMVDIQGGEFIRTRVIRIETGKGCAVLEDQTEIPYDLLSVNTGSVIAAHDIETLPEHTLRCKPFSNFMRMRQKILNWPSTHALRLLVIGGGAAGCETALNAAELLTQHRTDYHVTIISDSPRLIPGFPRRASTVVQKLLEERGIQVHLNCRMLRAEQRTAIFADGREEAFDMLILATGTAPSPLLQNSDIATDERGALQVNASLQSITHDNIFGAGDGICFDNRPLPGVSIHAVHQGRMLHHHLQARCSDQPSWQTFKPQKHFLSAMNLGKGYGLLTRNGLTFSGRWPMKLKDHTDRKFIQMYQQRTM